MLIVTELGVLRSIVELRRFRHVAAIALTMLLATKAAGEQATGIAPLPGAIVASGDGRPRPDVVRQLIESSGDSGVVHLLTLGDHKDSAAAWSVAVEAAGGRTDSLTAESADGWESATVVWTIGDGPLSSDLQGRIEQVLARGGLIGGSCLTDYCASHGIVLDPLFCTAIAPPDGALARITTREGVVGAGLHPGASLVISGRRIGALDAGVDLWLPCATDKVARSRRLTPGHADDLIALRRAASARLGEPFPAGAPAAPRVPGGSLLIGGGGRMPDEVWKRFVDLAGGVDAPIVVLPTAMERPSRRSPAAAKLRSLGARDVTVLTQRGAEEVASDDFQAALGRARGVWFDGGRQWRFVDAYEETSAVPLFHDVLARGGVIGGSSAGASIQAEYMVRGSPLGNHIMMAEGYERGLGFLPGVAIDQHFSQRNRMADLAGVIRRFPQLLGLGLDESTAIVVRGETLEVCGLHRVAIVVAPIGAPPDDNQARSDVEFEWLASPDRYDLRNRVVISAGVEHDSGPQK